MIKYTLDYYDNEGVPYHIDIDVESYTGSSSRIGGYAIHEYSSIKDVTEVIRGSSLTLILEADLANTFEDLYIEDEQSTKVSLYRDGTIIFVGWVNPDGIYQDWVKDRWDIEITCSDGLAYLEDLGYDDFGTPVIGNRDSELNIISRCLQKTGLELPIYTMLSTNYLGQTIGDEPLLAVNDQDRFVKKDEETNMSCKEILESILGKYRAYIKQANGCWYVMEIYDVFNNNDNFRLYDYNGGVISNSETVNTQQTLGSFSKGFYPHHAGANQKIEIDPSIAAYRIKFEYGQQKNQLTNPEFDYNGSSFPGWTILNTDKIESYSPLIIENDGGVSHIPVLKSSDIIVISAYNSLSVNIKMLQQRLVSDGFSVPKSFVRVELTDGTDSYYLLNDGSWSTDGIYGGIYIDRGSVGYVNFDIKSDLTPIDGNLYITLYSPVPTSGTSYVSDRWESLDLRYESSLNETGQIWTFKRNGRKSSVIKSTESVSLGDGEEDFYNSTIYESDASTPTTQWLDKSRRNVDGSITNTYVPIIETMGYKTMMFNSFPTKKFSGDFYGYLIPFEKINIDGVSSNFMIMSYKFNTKTNRGDIELREVFNQWRNEDVGYIYFDDITHFVSLDNGNSTEPTI